MCRQAVLFNHSVDCLERKQYLLPTEKHTLLRSLPYLIYLMDSDDKKNGLNAFKSKKIQLEKAQKFLKQKPVIPLYMDMQISAVFILQRCAHWNADEYVLSFVCSVVLCLLGFAFLWFGWLW